MIQIRCFVDVFFSFLFQLEYNFTLLGALVSIGGDLLLEVLLVLLVETDQIELLASCRRVGPIAFFYRCVLPRCVFLKKRNCVQPVCVLNATVFCPIAFKTQACLVRLRFKRNCASPVAFFDILTNRLKNAIVQSPVAFFIKIKS